MFLSGQGVKQSYDDAAKWSRKAADQGSAEAQRNLVSIYEEFPALREKVEGKKVGCRHSTVPTSARPLRCALIINDVTKIVSTYRENEMRFKRDILEEGSSESRYSFFNFSPRRLLSKNAYIVGFGVNPYLSDVDCRVTAPEDISIIANWNKGDKVHVEGIVKDVTMGSVQLDSCRLRNSPPSAVLSPVPVQNGSGLETPLTSRDQSPPVAARQI